MGCDWPMNIDVDVADNDTVATGCAVGAVMTSVAAPLTPSLVATMLTEPAPIVVTVPSVDTEASDGTALVHDTLRPLSKLPDASRTSACADVVCPTLTVGLWIVTVTAATPAGGGSATATVALELFPSTDALMLALPLATPVTRPELETVATVGFELLHTGTRDVSGLPDASYATAES